MSGGSEDHDGPDITLADVCAALGELHGLFHNLRSRVGRAEQRAARAELAADVAVTLAAGEAPEAPGDELTSGGDQS
jgi:hypothetical protein